MKRKHSKVKKRKRSKALVTEGTSFSGPSYGPIPTSGGGGGSNISINLGRPFPRRERPPLTKTPPPDEKPPDSINQIPPPVEEPPPPYEPPVTQPPPVSQPPPTQPPPPSTTQPPPVNQPSLPPISDELLEMERPPYIPTTQATTSGKGPVISTTIKAPAIIPKKAGPITKQPDEAGTFGGEHHLAALKKEADRKAAGERLRAETARILAAQEKSKSEARKRLGAPTPRKSATSYQRPRPGSRGPASSMRNKGKH
jgi:hypothetical protein